jgi:hypothetical protein
VNLGGQASEEVVLKACPFCGGEPDYGTLDNRWYIQCTNDGCPTHPVIARRVWDAAETAWNTRTPTPGDTGEIVERLIRVANEELRTFDRVSRATALKLLAHVEQQAATIAERDAALSQIEALDDGTRVARRMANIARATLERTKQP